MESYSFKENTLEVIIIIGSSLIGIGLFLISVIPFFNKFPISHKNYL